MSKASMTIRYFLKTKNKICKSNEFSASVLILQNPDNYQEFDSLCVSLGFNTFIYNNTVHYIMHNTRCKKLMSFEQSIVI